MAPLRIAIVAVLLALGALVVAGAMMYAADYGLEATVQETRCLMSGSEVDVKTKVFGIDHTVTGISPQACRLLQPGNFVEYHMRSQRTVLYQVEGGPCLWDTSKGLC